MDEVFSLALDSECHSYVSEKLHDLSLIFKHSNSASLYTKQKQTKRLVKQLVHFLFRKSFFNLESYSVTDLLESL